MGATYAGRSSHRYRRSVQTVGPELDATRRLVLERGLVRAAFEHLTVDAFLALPVDALAPTKALLKRFFSTESWGPSEVDALAAAVGPGEGRWRRELDADVTLEYGWTDGRFDVALEAKTAAGSAPGPTRAAADAIAASFEGAVVPQATPNPRTIRFQVGSVPDDRRRWYESAAAVQGDAGVSRLFAEFEQVTNVLVGPDFVAVSLHRPSDWESLLLPILAVVSDEFAADAPGREEDGAPRVVGGAAATARGGPSRAGGRRRTSRLDEAWAELGSLRPAEPADLAALQAAAAGEDPFRRQVAANLLREAEPAVAAPAWSRLLDDRSRSVRRVTVDAMVDAGREELRPLLERALSDTDAWIRWKALRGLVELGAGSSQDAIAPLETDPDFRVRLEVAALSRKRESRSPPPPAR